MNSILEMYTNHSITELYYLINIFLKIIFHFYFSPCHLMQRVFLFALVLCLSVVASPIGCGERCGVHFEAEKPGLQDCSLHYYNQTVDHFSYALPTGGSYYFEQRYIV